MPHRDVADACYASLLATYPCWEQNQMGEARMDIIESEIAYLGFHDSESYGLVWKVSLWARELVTSTPEHEG